MPQVWLKMLPETKKYVSKSPIYKSMICTYFKPLFLKHYFIYWTWYSVMGPVKCIPGLCRQRHSGKLMHFPTQRAGHTVGYNRCALCMLLEDQVWQPALGWSPEIQQTYKYKINLWTTQACTNHKYPDVFDT